MSGSVGIPLCVLCVLCGCLPPPLPPPPPPALTVCPVDADRLVEIIPLGNLNPPGHTFPTDHIYLCREDRAEPLPVVAPAAGRIVWMRRTEGEDAKIMVEVTGAFRYCLDHVLPGDDVREGIDVAAGQRLGTTSPRAHLDLGVVNDEVTLTGFVNPARYPSDTIHCDGPLKYFEEPLRTRLYALVRREGPDKDGRIDFDRPGRLVGNWFLEGLPVDESAGPDAWPRHLAFVYDNHDPSQLRVAIGGTLAVAGAFGVAGDAPDPATVTPETGRVTYRLLDARDAGLVRATLIVEMLDASRLRVEAFPGDRADAAFDDAARVYER